MKIYAVVLILTATTICPASDSTKSIVVRKSSKWRNATPVLLSLALPGTGRLMENRSPGSIVVSAAFLAAEAVAWAVFFVNRSEGYKYERRFERYANENWDANRYVEFLEQSLNLPDQYLGRDENIDRTRLLNAEDDWGAVTGVSVHHLYETGRQQYYEMIYKYPEQFALGWSDVVSNPSALPYTGYTRLNPTSMMLEYRSMRNKSNDHFGTSRAMVGVFLVNRLFSVFDTTIFAGRSESVALMQFRVMPVTTLSGSFAYAPTLRIWF